MEEEQNTAVSLLIPEYQDERYQSYDGGDGDGDGDGDTSTLQPDEGDLAEAVSMYINEENLIPFVSIITVSSGLIFLIIGLLVEPKEMGAEADIARRGPVALLLSNSTGAQMCDAYGITLTPYSIILAKTAIVQLLLSLSPSRQGCDPAAVFRNRYKISKFSLVVFAYQFATCTMNFVSMYIRFLRGNGASTSSWDSFQMFHLIMTQSAFFETSIQMIINSLSLHLFDIAEIDDRTRKNPKRGLLMVVGAPFLFPIFLSSFFVFNLPVALSYLWILLTFFLPYLVLIIIKGDDYLAHRASDTAKFFWGVLFKVGLTMFYIWYVQAVIVYGILLYSGENYMRGIQIDFSERTVAAFQACIEAKVYKEWTTFSNFLAMF